MQANKFQVDVNLLHIGRAFFIANTITKVVFQIIPCV